MSALLEVRGVVTAYGKIEALRGVDLSVAEGQITCLLGPNGAGKTTTIRTLAGIIPASGGRLAVAGHDLRRAPLAAKAALGYIPDEPRLFDTLTVWEHLAFSAAAYRVDDFSARAETLLSEFELQDKRDALAHGLSRGMRQKVAVACAYLHRPPVLLFDEPLTGLDPRGIRAVQHSMRERARQGAALVVSSHLLSLVESLCSHLLILHRGRCRGFGPLAEVLRAAAGRTDAGLEEAFFATTEDGAEPPP